MYTLIKYGVFLAAVIMAAVGVARAQAVPCTPGYCVDVQQDTDLWVDAWDNCLTINNNDQTDSDGDGIGNRCDPDFDQSGTVTANDFNTLRAFMNTDDDHTDLNGSGMVTAADFAILKSFLNLAPGPAAPAYVTLGGDTYSQVQCNYPEGALTCDLDGPFDLVLNLPNITGSVLTDLKCYPIPPSPVPTGVPNTIWGLASATEGGLTVCRLLD